MWLPQRTSGKLGNNEKVLAINLRQEHHTSRRYRVRCCSRLDVESLMRTIRRRLYPTHLYDFDSVVLWHLALQYRVVSVISHAR